MKKYYKIIQKIIGSNLASEDFFVFLFGSRATGNEGKKSDIDVGVLGKFEAPLADLSRIRDELEESMIPYHVEIIDFFVVSEQFRKMALTKIKIWNKPDFDLPLN